MSTTPLEMEGLPIQATSLHDYSRPIGLTDDMKFAAIDVGNLILRYRAARSQGRTGWWLIGVERVIEDAVGNRMNRGRGISHQ